MPPPAPPSELRHRPKTKADSNYALLVRTLEHYEGSGTLREKGHLNSAAGGSGRQLPVYTKWHYIWLLMLTAGAFITRFWYLDHPNEVVFDEVHFGKFGSYYLKRSYFFDVHPPLGKMLIAATGYAAGFNGSYLFDKIGEDYESRDVPYVALRALPATFGALLVPLVFGILAESSHSLAACVLGGTMVLLETALITQSRLILLDAFLLFFDILSVYGWIRFYKLRNRPFSSAWWKWLLVTGVSLALCMGVKMVGLFGVALIGMVTLQDLWRLLDIRRGLDMADVMEHFLSRAATLIIVPLVLYLSLFAIHFAVVNRSGPGDSFMSPPFQATLAKNRFNQDSQVVHYGTNISMLHYDTNAYLHSHAHNYPLRYETDRVSSQGQQVTGYPHVDSNNLWTLIPENFTEFMEDRHSNGSTSPRAVRHMDVVYLKHLLTEKYLLTHDVASPLTATNQEITCIDPVEKADRLPEALWRVEIDAAKQNTNATLNTIDSKFRLVHIKTGVALHSHKGLYGEWGFQQQEVNGNKKAQATNNLWIVHTQAANTPPVLARGATKADRPGFLLKFLELQNVMVTQNAGLTASHPFQSRPGSWPVLGRGISFWVDKANKAQIYLLGNPFIWWFSIFTVGAMLWIMLIDSIAMRRGIDALGTGQLWSITVMFVRLICLELRRRLWFTGGFFLLGWALHYIPFFIMGRALFLHHYLPALIFSIMVTASVLDTAMWQCSFRTRWAVTLALIVAFATTFYLFAPFAYGFSLDEDQINFRKWLSAWDFQFGSSQ